MKHILQDKRNIIIFSILFVIVVAAFFSSSSSIKGSGEIVAKVKGKSLYESDVEDFLKSAYNWQGEFDFNSLPDENKQALIQQVVARKMLISKAKNSAVARDEATKMKISNATNKILAEEFLSKIGEEAVSDENVKQRYKKLSEQLTKEVEGKEELKAKHILVKTREEAYDVIRALNSKSFEEVAKEKSIDYATAQKGGDLGYFIEDRMVEKFSKAAKSLQVGRISGPVKTKFGWHIIQLDDRRPASVPPLSEVRPQIVQELSSEAVQNFMQNLLINSDIEYEFSTVEVEDDEAEETNKDQG